MSNFASLFKKSNLNNFQQEIILQAPVPIFIVEGADFIIKLSNENNLKKWQRTQEEVLGKPLFDVFPEGKTQPFFGFLTEIYQTGVGIKLDEQKAEFYRNGVLDTAWFDISYEPVKNPIGEVMGIMAISVEVTAQVLARKKIENSEKGLKHMADAMPHLVWMADEKGNIDFYNKRVYEYGGLKEDVDKNLLWQNIVHPEDFEKTLKTWQNALHKKTLYSSQHRLRSENGLYRWFLSRAFCEEDVENKTYKWFGSSTDIHEQKKTELKIKQTEEFNRTVLESNPDCLKVIDKEGRIQYMNYNGQCLLEIDDFKTVKNKMWWELWGDENKDVVKQSIKKALSGENVQFIAQALTVKGNPKWWDVMVSPVNNPHGEIKEILSVSRDITLQKQIEDNLKKTQERLNAGLKIGSITLSEVSYLTNTVKLSPESAAMYGFSPDELVVTRQQMHDTFHPDIKEELEAQIVLAMNPDSGGYMDLEHPIILPSGETRWLKVNKQFFFDHSVQPAKPIYSILVAQDITEQKRSEIIIKESEEKYRGLFETMDQGFCIVEVIFDENNEPLDYRFLESNPTLKNQTGLDNVNGKTIKEIVPDIEIIWAQKYGQVVLTGESVKFVDYSEAMNTWFEVYAFRLGDRENNKVAILFTNITERKKAEETIKASEEKFRLLTETIPQMVWMSNEKGINEYISSQWLEYSGIMPKSEEEWSQITHPDDADKTLKAWEVSLKTGENLVVETRIKNKEGEYRWHVSIGVPLKNDKNEVIKWIGSVTDIHDQKLKEQKKDEFISIASHEMKTPLTSAKAYLQLLEMSLDENDPTFIYAKKASDAVERLNKLISELLDASKIQHGKLDYTNTTFDFDTMIVDTIENVQYSSVTHKIIKAGSIEKHFLGDKDRLQQVVINLLTNAIKYSPDANEVIVNVLQENNHLQVSVIDKGVGMPEKHLSKVFERYYRVEEHAIQFQGLGIGLYISYDIIQRHNGKMWVESITGKGSTFHFTLPFAN